MESGLFFLISRYCFIMGGQFCQGCHLIVLVWLRGAGISGPGGGGLWGVWQISSSTLMP